MIYSWLHKSTECGTLIVFFNGWGMTQRVVQHLDVQGYDVLVLGGYDGKDIDYNVFDGYKNIYLVAWSMGVWYASTLGLEEKVHFKQKIAFCGTVKAVDNTYGIPKNVFEATVAGLSERSREKFAMRIFGGKKAFDAMCNDVLVPFDDAKKELFFWSENKDKVFENGPWNTSFIGLDDMIYPIEAQRLYWQENGAKTVECKCSHYPFGQFASWKEIIELSDVR